MASDTSFLHLVSGYDQRDHGRLKSGRAYKWTLHDQLWKPSTSSIVENVDLIVKGVEGIKTGVEGIKTGVEGVKTGVEGVKTGVEGVKTGVEGVKTGVEGVKTGVEGVKTGVEGVKTGVEGVKTGVEGVRTGVEGVRTGVEGVRTGVEGVRTGVEGIKKDQEGGGKISQLRVEPCETEPCIFPRLGKTNFEITFKTNAVFENLTLYFKVAYEGLEVPLFNYDLDGCQGKNLQCPLMESVQYTLKHELEMEDFFPAEIMQTPHDKPVISFKTKTIQRNFIDPGRRQSYSGSETDISTSTENLTAEEKHVLRNGVRQEPQGEETNLNDDEMDPSLSNTLIIHHNTPSDNYSSHFYSKKSLPSSAANLGLTGNMFRFKEYSVTSSGAQQIAPSNLPPATFHSVPKHADLKLNSGNGNNNTRRRSSGSSPRSSGSVPASPKGSPRRTLYPPYAGVSPTSNHANLKFDGISAHDVGSYSGESQPDHSVQEITEIPKHYLDQSEVLKHLAKEVHSRQTSPNDSVPKSLSQSIFPFTPPDYAPKWYNGNLDVDPKVSHNDLGGASDDSSNSSTYRYSRAGKGGHLRSNSLQRRLSISRSHPDLTHVGLGVNKTKEQTQQTSSYGDGRTQRPKTRGRAALEVDSETPSSQMLQMIEILSADNASLKNELEHFHHKVSKLQSFEMEIQKVHQSHEELVRSSDKRERLEKAIRSRLEGEIRRLMESNRELKAQLEAVSANMRKQHNQMGEVEDSELRRELSKRDVMIAQLLSQNKELLAEKDRHEIELQAQRATLQEQRNHIDILDNALTNAQANVVRLEEENRKKQVYVDRVGTLQRALNNVQLASERRLTMEKRLRAQLEKEIETLKREKEGKYSGDFHEPINGSTEELKKLLRQYEEKIIGLEAEVTKWEQRYVEESTMRQIAVDAAAGTKDAKIAALERTSQESEKLIAQARTEKLRHMDEIYAAQRKSTELEGKIKDMESKLAERDAMIKVLQQHSQEKDAVLQNAVRGRPPRHSHTRAASSVGISTSTSSPSSGGGKNGGGHGNHSASMGGSVGNSPDTLGNNNGGSASISSSNSSSATLHRRVGSKDEMAGSNSMMSPKVMKRCSPIALMTDSSEDEKKTLDEQLKELDSRLSSKDSIISALRAEKEKYPSHFWRV